MEHLFIYPVLALTCCLLYKVFRQKSHEKKLREEMAGLRAGLEEAQVQLAAMKTGGLPDSEDAIASYTSAFLREKLTGARRQTYIHDSLYVILAKVLPVIAPNMSVPTFVNSVLSEHLARHQDTINEMYRRKAIQKPL